MYLFDRLSIRWKIFLIILVALLPIALTTGYIIYAKYKSGYREAGNAAMATVRSIAQQHYNHVEGIRNLLFALSLSPEVRNGNTDACNAVIRKILSDTPFLLNIGLADLHGNLIASGIRSDFSIGDRKYFRDVLQTGRFSAGEYVMSRDVVRPAIQFAAPVNGPAGKPVAVLFATYDLSRFDVILNEQKLPADSALNVSDHKGVVLHHYPAIDRARPGVMSTFRQFVTGPEEEGVFVADGLDGVRKIFAFRRLRLRPEDPPYMYIRAGLPVKTVMAGVDRFIAGSAALSLLVLTLAIVSTRVLTGCYLVAPIEEMLNVTNSLRKGDFTVRLNPRCPEDELGALSHSLDEMTAALEKRMHERDQAESMLRLSEENLAVTLNSIGDGVIATDAVGRVTRMNAVAEKLTGWPSEDASGRPLEEVFIIVNEDSRQPVVNPVANVLENGEIVGLANHTILIARDGTERPIADSGAPIKDRQGEIIGVVLVFRDQTQERAKERRIVKARDFYLTIFEEFPALIWRAGLDGRRDYFNKTWIDFRGRTLEEESGDGWTEGVHPGDMLRCLSTYLSAFDEREPFEMEYRLLHRDGEYRWIYDIGRPYNDLEGAFAGFIGSCFDMTEKKNVSDDLAKSEELLRKIFEATPDLIMVVDREYRIVRSNWHTVCAHVSPETREKGLHCYDILQEANQCIPRECPHLRVFDSGQPYLEEKELPGLGLFEMRSYPVFDETGTVALVVHTLRDITKQQKTEDQLRHLQKMEALSTLVGGIAHDFNNILTAIVGYGTILMMKLAKDDPLREEIIKIMSAADKATTLTSGLLAYSRKSPVSLHPVDINEVIGNLDKLLSRIIGEDIEMAITPASGNLPVLADTGQIEQVVMNLVANSRDAMPNGGKITIGLSEAHINRDFINSYGYGEEGRYALISISDNGAGMDKTTKERIFEPFFTTKEVGKGTGLGLSIVYGIVKQHHGYINLYSEPGYGTTFRIYLPLTVLQSEDTTFVEQSPEKGKGETILLIEDNDELRSLTRQILNCFDYRVLEAENGDRAMEIFRKHADDIDLILSDIIMPRKSGRETLEEIRKLKADTKALFMSGYMGDIISGRGIDTEGMELLFKPFAPNTLLAKVREILDRSGR